MIHRKTYLAIVVLVVIGALGLIWPVKKYSLPTTISPMQDNDKKAPLIITSSVQNLFSLDGLPPEISPVMMLDKIEPTQSLENWILTGIVTTESKKLATFKNEIQRKTLYINDTLEGFTVKSITGNSVIVSQGNNEYIFELNTS